MDSSNVSNKKKLYTAPAVYMYVNEKEDSEEEQATTSDEEEELARQHKKSKELRNNPNAARVKAVDDTLKSADKRGSDSAYSSLARSGKKAASNGAAAAAAPAVKAGRSFAHRTSHPQPPSVFHEMPIAKEDGASTMNSVPVDPSTKVPVFVCPYNVMEFLVAGDSPDTRRILSIYNTYEYVIRFQILCTAPEYYALQMPTGEIRPSRVVDVPIRGLPKLRPKMVHKLKVEIRKIDGDELLGSRIIVLRSVATATPTTEDQSAAYFHRMAAIETQTARVLPREPPPSPPPPPPPARSVNLSLLIVVSCLCALALTLPIQHDATPLAESMVPQYLYISETQRVVAAFIVGVCVVLILQPAAGYGRVAAPRP